MAGKDAIYIKKYVDAPLHEREIYRYAGIMGVSDDISDSLSCLVSDVISECKDSFSYRVCYRRLPLSKIDKGLLYPFSAESLDLLKCLSDSDECIMLAATVGHDIDRLITKYQRFEPSRALIMQAYGAERVESLLDVFCAEMEKEMEKEGLHLTPRYSPGYGDLSLEVQKDFFRILDISHQIGISLGDSLLMRPSKSVTAIAGITKKCISKDVNKCSICTNIDCPYKDA